MDRQEVQKKNELKEKSIKDLEDRKSNNELMLKRLEEDININSEAIDIKLKDLTPKNPNFGFELLPEWTEWSKKKIMLEHSRNIEDAERRMEQIIKQNKEFDKQIKKVKNMKAENIEYTG